MPSTVASKVFSILALSWALSVPDTAGSGITERAVVMATAIGRKLTVSIAWDPRSAARHRIWRKASLPWAGAAGQSRTSAGWSGFWVGPGSRQGHGPGR